MREALVAGVASDDVILNIMARQRDRQRPLTLQSPQLTTKRPEGRCLALLAPPAGLLPPYAASSAKSAPVIAVPLLGKGDPFERRLTRECAQSGVNHPRYLLRLIELELIDRERRTIERRIRAPRFPAVKSFDTFEFTAIPSLNKMMVLELARCE